MARAEVVVELMQPDDWPAVRAIYVEGIASGDATFETTVPDWTAWDAAHLGKARLVARVDADIVGFAVLSSYSTRAAYRGVAWESVYVAAARQGQGVGRALLRAAIAAADTAGFWALMAGILAENTASLALHEWAGFRRVGVLERIGRDASGRWRDVVLMQHQAARPSGETQAG